VGLLAEITEKLLAGKSPDALIRQGYAKSSVYRQAARLKKSDINPDTKTKINNLEKELAGIQAKAAYLEEQNTKLSAENLQLARILGQAETQIKQLTATVKKPWWQFWR